MIIKDEEEGWIEEWQKEEGGGGGALGLDIGTYLVFNHHLTLEPDR